jgi:hypothetical protein
MRSFFSVVTSSGYLRDEFLDAQRQAHIRRNMDHQRCGVLLIAAEGSDGVRLRLDAVVRAKCGGKESPFRLLISHQFSSQMAVPFRMVASAWSSSKGARL